MTARSPLTLMLVGPISQFLKGLSNSLLFRSIFGSTRRHFLRNIRNCGIFCISVYPDGNEPAVAAVATSHHVIDLVSVRATKMHRTRFVS